MANDIINGQTIADSMGVSRVAVHKITFRAINKIFDKLTYRGVSPSDAIIGLCREFGADEDPTIEQLTFVFRFLTDENKIKAATEMSKLVPNSSECLEMYA